MNRNNRIGQSIDPWGTPTAFYWLIEKRFEQLTNCSRAARPLPV